MKTTRKPYSADFKSKVARQAIRGGLTLAELGAKHGIHRTMIAAWKRQAIDGMASTLAGTSELARASGEAESAGSICAFRERARLCQHRRRKSLHIAAQGWHPICAPRL